MSKRIEPNDKAEKEFFYNFSTILTEPIKTIRLQKCQEFKKMMDEKHLILIRSPPMSGKTSIAHFPVIVFIFPFHHDL